MPRKSKQFANMRAMLSQDAGGNEEARFTGTSPKLSNMRNLTVSLPTAVMDRLRVLAAERKVSVNRFVELTAMDETRSGSCRTVDINSRHWYTFG
jgi:predicted ATP-grasp superfamily ATP-dependent carboligase